MRRRLSSMAVSVAVLLSLTAAASADTIYVNGTTGNDDWDGRCEVWDGGTCGPKRTIQAGIDVSANGDEVLIADGTYAGVGNKNLSFAGKAIVVRSASGNPETCQIDCQGDGRGFSFQDAEGPDSVLRDLKIINGVAPSGGAISCVGSSPSIIGCVFEDCTAEDRDSGGGALYVAGETPFLSNCRVSNNFAVGKGGGVYVIAGELTMQDCLLEANEATRFGGGLHNEDRTVLEACTILENRARAGGGVASDRGRLTISGCLFEGNLAEDSRTSRGGGLYSSDFAASITACDFVRNTATEGGGAFVDGGRQTIVSCEFLDNVSDFGAGLFSRGADELTLSECRFTRNDAGEAGGGARIVTADDVTVTRCTFEHNQAEEYGGGLYVRARFLEMNESVFNDNTCNGQGGGIFNSGGFEPKIVNCVIAANSARIGGGLYNLSSDIRVINCEFINNVAGQHGGGMASAEPEDSILTSCTFVGNTAPNGRAFSASGSGAVNAVLTNCILWNGGREIFENGSGTTTVTSCDVEGNWLGIHNFDADPLFVDPDGPDNDPNTWQDNDYSLSAASPCVNMGDDEAPFLPNTDILGGPRIGQCRVDLGARESDHFRDCNSNGRSDACDIADGTEEDCNRNGRPDACDISAGRSPDTDANDVPDECESPIRRVNETAPTGGNGLTWETAYTDLQAALFEAATMPGVIAEIWVASGTYVPDAGIGERRFSFKLMNGVALYGGFAGHETERGQRDWMVNETILSGDLNGDDGPKFENYEENSFHVVNGSESDESALLDGFTVTAGNAEWFRDVDHAKGAGIFNDRGSPTIRNCTITRNWAQARSESRGAGIYNFRSNARIMNCTFTANRGRFASGVYNAESTPLIADCVFDGNEIGAAIYCFNSDANVTRCVFRNNEGPSIWNKRSSPIISDCLFEHNQQSPIMNNDRSGPTIDNCDFIQNVARGNGGAIDSENGRSERMVLNNCRFIENIGRNGGAIFSSPGDLEINDCLFAGNWAGLSAGGLWSHEGSVTLKRCIFIGNSAGTDGGGWVSVGSIVSAIDCVFAGNSAGDDGGGVFSREDQLSLTNCLFTDNEAAEDGGAFMVENQRDTAVIEMANCTLADNEAVRGSALAVNSFGGHLSSIQLDNCILWSGEDGIWNGDGSTITVRYSSVQGGRAGEGNIDADPLFVDPDDGDYRLGFRSPCVDAGDNESVPPEVVTDLNGNPRFVDDPATPDSGNGMPPVVDMGAFEFQTMLVPTDIKPGSCPNPLNRTSRGKVPIAVVGTSEFDVSMIDVESLVLTRADGVGGALAPLSGPPGPRIRVEDVATPFEGDPCDCHELQGDGIDDLSMKFDTQTLVAELELSGLPGGAFIELVISGQLLDGANFSGIDCIRLVPPDGGELGLGIDDGETPDRDTRPKPSLSVGLLKENAEDAADESTPPTADPAPIGCGGVMPSFLLATLTGMWLMTRRVRPI